MRTYASPRVKRKSCYRKCELQRYLLISGSHTGANVKRSTNMASPYKVLQRCVKGFGKKLKTCGPQIPETSSSTGWFSIYFFVE